MVKFKAIPLTLAQANQLVTKWHRHHKPFQGQRFSIGLLIDGQLSGAAIVSRPISPHTNQQLVAEVTRLVTNGDKNACSFLYASCARACAAMGFEKIQTFILESETGVTLKASGWIFDGLTGIGEWENGYRLRTRQPICMKQRWKKDLIK